MVKKIKLLQACLIILLAFMLLLAVPALANAVAAATADLVVDQSGSFTAAQVSQLEQAAATLGTQYAMDIVIVTTDDTGGKSSRAYADDFFDNKGYGIGPGRDGILFLLDFDNREAYISTSGSGIRYLTDARIESILDEVFAAGMADGNYFGATQAFLSATGKYLAAGIPSDQYNEPESGPNTLTGLEGILGAVASGVLGLGFFSGTRRSYKGHPRREIFEYQKNSLMNLGISAEADNLVNSFVTTRRIPRNTGTGSSGRSSTHTSSSGRTHGGGGRRF